MYYKNKMNRGSIVMSNAYDGEPIEHKIDRILHNNEPITDGAPIVFQERNDGVQAAYNPRTDRFEIAVDAMNKVHKSSIAKREAKIVDFNKGGNDGGAEPTQGTTETPNN